MCGIAGIAGTRRPELLSEMCDAIAHRGPDDAGLWWDDASPVGLGHRRLAILDLTAAGHQPMTISGRRLHIAYNGEIYNFREQRSRLEGKGIRFTSNTDTEVILRLWEERGVDSLKLLNGMFAIAIWDADSRELFLVRDHVGIKPLYYWQHGREIYFASEIKALTRIPELTRSIAADNLEEYLTFLWVPGNRTMLRDVEKLEPGQYLKWHDGDVCKKHWFELSYEPDNSLSESDWIELVRETFKETVDRQMVSDAPLGAFLSGGLDSSSIVAFMRAAHPDRELNTYTAKFPEGDIAQEQGADDYPYAKAVAHHLGVNLKEIEMRPDAIRLLPKMVYHLDEPDADPAIFPSYLIAKLAREDGTTVLLSGTGGDEVFFGYRSHLAYRSYERIPRSVAAVLGPALSGAAKIAGSLGGQQVTAIRRARKFLRGLQAQPGLDRHMAVVDWSEPAIRSAIILPEHLQSSTNHPESMVACSKRFRGTGELNYHSYMLTQTFLAAHNFLYTDKSSMATSLEVRVPFTDLKMLQLGARIPMEMQLKNGETKFLLKKALEGILPNHVIYRPKTGFGAPLRRWMRHDLRETVRDALAPERVRQRGLFSPDAVTRALDANEKGTQDNAYLIYALLNLEIWMQTFIDRAGEPVSF